MIPRGAWKSGFGITEYLPVSQISGWRHSSSFCSQKRRKRIECGKCGTSPWHVCGFGHFLLCNVLSRQSVHGYNVLPMDPAWYESHLFIWPPIFKTMYWPLWQISTWNTVWPMLCSTIIVFLNYSTIITEITITKIVRYDLNMRHACMFYTC